MATIWQTPKTNWLRSDYLTPVDWNRITGNMAYLKDFGQDYYSDLQSLVLEYDSGTKTVSDWIFPSELNAIENDLENINLASVQIDIGQKPLFEAYGYAVTWTELNRIESMTLAIYEEIRILGVLSIVPYRSGTDWILSPSASDIGLL